MRGELSVQTRVNLRRVLVPGAVIAGLSWVAGCGDSTTDPGPPTPPPPPPDPPAATTVGVSPAAAGLSALGATVQLQAEVRDQNGQPMAGAAVAWSTGSPGVATVDASGLVTAAGNGTAAITATSGSASGNATVTVAQAADSVAVSPAEATMAPGDTLRLAAETRDANGHPVEGAEFSWASSDEAAATVDASGLVTAVADGTATITASSGAARGDAEITVADGDRAVLVALYEATNGAGWLRNEGWLSDRPIGQWYGVTTGSDGRVTALRLSASNLVGSIPPELGHLAHLETLDFERNVLAGPIPPELGGLAGLRSLILGVNRLTGGIPPELGDLAGLEVLRLRRNSLAGPVPPELGRLGNLRRLGLERNRLTGSIPSAFMAVDRLRTLHFEGNDGLCASGSADSRAWLAGLDVYAGPLCDEGDRAVLTSLHETAGGLDWARADGWLGDGVLDEWHGIDADSVGRVVGIDLSDNGLAGRIPPLLAQLGSLASLRIGGNPQLGGPLPLSLSALSLRELHYAETGLCVSPDRSFGDWLGAIPSHEGTGTECSALTDREILALLYEATGGARWNEAENWLSDRPLDEWTGVTTGGGGDGGVTGLSLALNNLAGLIPPELGSLSGLIELNLLGNELTGPVPPELGNLSSLATLNITVNDLTGPIPPELGRLSELETLSMGSNYLTGPIPPELGSLSALTTLDLAINDLTGPIPPELGSLSDLTTLDLGINDLTGPVPAELGGLSSLERLDLGINDLTGPIPAELGGLSSLITLTLGANDLRGPIPAELGGLSSLERLVLSGDGLTGPIPPELGRLTRLTTLTLSDNDLTGPIPAELGDLSGLEQLFLNQNDLTGPVPPELGSLSELRSMSLAGNRLTGPLPAELGDLDQLIKVYMSNNPGLSGPLPLSLAGLAGLSELLLNDTGLCAPDDADFRAWLSRLPFAQVRRCDMMQGAGAYLTQVVQSAAFPVPLVAGEAALLRVFLTASRSTSEGLPPLKATFYVNGDETYAVDIPGSDVPIPTSVEEAEGALEKSANAEIPASVIQPGLEFVVEVDPAHELDPGLGVARRIPETGRASVRVETVPPLDITFVPFVWAAGSDRSIVDVAEAMAADPQGHELLWDTRTLLPVRDLDVKAHEPILTSTTNVFTLNRETALAWVMEGRMGRYMGIMPEYVIGGQSGVASIGGSYSFSVADSHVIAHELGHNLRLFHAPCGGAGGPDPAFPQPDGSIGDWGYDFRDGTLVPPNAADLMSYCGHPRWISGYGFTRAMNHRIPFALDATASARATASAVAAVEAPTRTLLLWGGLDAGGAPFLEPAFALDAPPAVPSSPGAYRLTGRAGTGEALFSVSFDMTETADGDGRATFVIALPARPEWVGRLESITLSGPGGSTAMDRTTDRPMAILRDPDTGRVRGILRGPASGDPVRAVAAAGLAAAAAAGSELEILVSRGIPGGR